MANKWIRQLDHAIVINGDYSFPVEDPPIGPEPGDYFYVTLDQTKEWLDSQFIGSVNSFSTLASSITLIKGRAYVTSVAAPLVATLPLATGSGSVVSVKTLSSNVGFTEILAGGSDTIDVTGTSQTSITSTGAMTVFLRDIGAAAWSVDSIIGAWTSA